MTASTPSRIAMDNAASTSCDRRSSIDIRLIVDLLRGPRPGAHGRRLLSTMPSMSDFLMEGRPGRVNQHPDVAGWGGRLLPGSPPAPERTPVARSHRPFALVARGRCSSPCSPGAGRRCQRPRRRTSRRRSSSSRTR
ncbi:hypothetical protein NKG05_18430 [Oerskovia sp. M15]